MKLDFDFDFDYDKINYMNINWYGQSCFQINLSREKNNPVSVLIDPFDEEYVGLKLPRNLGADVVLVTHEHKDHNNTKRVSGSPFIISGPGEYDIKSVYIQGIPAFHDNSKGAEKGSITIYTIKAEEIKLCHLGDLGQKELTSEQLDKIGEINILMVPVGGEAIKIISQIEPNIIIPMHYHIPGLKIKLDGVDKFLKCLGIKSLEPLPKLSIKKKDISEDEAKVITLQP